MGGEVGANAPPNPTLEILPRIPGGNTTVYLDWLQRTDPNNLYPFLHVLLVDAYSLVSLKRPIF